MSETQPNYQASRNLIRDLIKDKVEFHLEWNNYKEAQKLINAARKLFFTKTADRLQEKLERELALRNQLKQAS